jgi:hypothetical protein
MRCDRWAEHLDTAPNTVGTIKAEETGGFRV